jgi:hypothetical protein
MNVMPQHPNQNAEFIYGTYIPTHSQLTHAHKTDQEFWREWYVSASKANGEFIYDPYRSRANLIDIAGMIQHETGDTLTTLPMPPGFGTVQSFFSSLYNFVGARASQTKEAVYSWIVQPVCVCVLYLCVYIYIYIHMHVYIYINTYVCMYIYIYIYTGIHMGTQIH